MWDFLKQNVVALGTVFAGIVALIAARLDLIDGATVPKVTLALLCLLATSEIVEKSRKLQQIHDSIQTGFERITAGLGAADVTRLGASGEAHQYMAAAVRRARRSLAYAALGRGYTRALSSQKHAFHEAIASAIDHGEIRITYVTAFYDKFRWERVQRWLSRPNITKFYVGHYPVAAMGSILGVATLYFLVIDDSEVIVRLPKPIGEAEEYLLLREPMLVELFRDYFALLWKSSVKISERTLDATAMEEIGRSLEEPTEEKR